MTQDLASVGAGAFPAPESVQTIWEDWRKPLFAYIYRMVTHHQDAEDLLQEVFVRVLQNRQKFRGESKFQTWLFGIATHICLDHLRSKKRWRVDAQLIGEQETIADPKQVEQLTAVMTHPDFVFEIREHVAFCFSCVARTLEPDQQAALMLKEVFGFTGEEAAAMLEVSEPVFRHSLSEARSRMTGAYEGLCQLINKTGACWQCQGLRGFAQEPNRGADLVQIHVAEGMTVTAENLFEERLRIVRAADLEEGRGRPLHDLFYRDLAKREQARAE